MTVARRILGVFRALRGRVGDAVVCGCAVVVFAAAVAVVSGDLRGALEIAPAEIALGTVTEGDVRTITFTVSNPKETGKRFVVAPSCACMSSREGPIEVGPRSSVSFDVRVDTARRPGFNRAHVQIADEAGAPIAQSTLSYTTVQRMVFEPQVLFLRGGDAEVSTIAFALGADPPESIVARAEDPAVHVGVLQTGSRTWRLAASLRGVPRSHLTSIRVSELRKGMERGVGEVMITLPTSRLGDLRISPAAERVSNGRCRAWILVETDAPCDIRVAAVSGPASKGLDWHASAATDGTGSRLWIELLYPSALGGMVADVDLVVGHVREQVSAKLPRSAS